MNHYFSWRYIFHWPHWPHFLGFFPLPFESFESLDSLGSRRRSSATTSGRALWTSSAKTRRPQRRSWENHHGQLGKSWENPLQWNGMFHSHVEFLAILSVFQSHFLGRGRISHVETQIDWTSQRWGSPVYGLRYSPIYIYTYTYTSVYIYTG